MSSKSPFGPPPHPMGKNPRGEEANTLPVPPPPGPKPPTGELGASKKPALDAGGKSPKPPPPNKPPPPVSSSALGKKPSSSRISGGNTNSPGKSPKPPPPTRPPPSTSPGKSSTGTPPPANKPPPSGSPSADNAKKGHKSSTQADTEAAPRVATTESHAVPNSPSSKPPLPSRPLPPSSRTTESKTDDSSERSKSFQPFSGQSTTEKIFDDPEKQPPTSTKLSAKPPNPSTANTPPPRKSPSAQDKAAVGGSSSRSPPPRPKSGKNSKRKVKKPPPPAKKPPPRSQNSPLPSLAGNQKSHGETETNTELSSDKGAAQGSPHQSTTQKNPETRDTKDDTSNDVTAHSGPTEISGERSLPHKKTIQKALREGETNKDTSHDTIITLSVGNTVQVGNSGETSFAHDQTTSVDTNVEQEKKHPASTKMSSSHSKDATTSEDSEAVDTRKEACSNTDASISISTTGGDESQSFEEGADTSLSASEIHNGIQELNSDRKATDRGHNGYSIPESECMDTPQSELGSSLNSKSSVQHSTSTEHRSHEESEDRQAFEVTNSKSGTEEKMGESLETQFLKKDTGLGSARQPIHAMSLPRSSDLAVRLEDAKLPHSEKQLRVRSGEIQDAKDSFDGQSADQTSSRSMDNIPVDNTHRHHGELGIKGRRSVSSNDLQTSQGEYNVYAKTFASSHNLGTHESKKGIFKRFGFGRKDSASKPVKERLPSMFQRLKRRATGRKKNQNALLDPSEIPEVDANVDEMPEGEEEEEPPPLPELPSIDELGEPPEHLLKALKAHEERVSRNHRNAAGVPEKSTASGVPVSNRESHNEMNRMIYSDATKNISAAAHVDLGKREQDHFPPKFSLQSEQDAASDLEVDVSYGHTDARTSSLGSQNNGAEKVSSKRSLQLSDDNEKMCREIVLEIADRACLVSRQPTPRRQATPAKSKRQAKKLLTTNLELNEDFVDNQYSECSELDDLRRSLESIRIRFGKEMSREFPFLPDQSVIALMNSKQRLNQLDNLHKKNEVIEKRIYELCQVALTTLKLFLPEDENIEPSSLDAYTVSSRLIGEWLPALVSQLCFVFSLKARMLLSQYELRRQYSQSVDIANVGFLQLGDLDSLRQGVLIKRAENLSQPSKIGSFPLREVDHRRLEAIKLRWSRVLSLRAFIGSICLFADSSGYADAVPHEDIEHLGRWMEIEELVIDFLREHTRNTVHRLKRAVAESKKNNLQVEFQLSTSQLQDYLSSIRYEIEQWRQGFGQVFDEEEWSFLKTTCKAWTKRQQELAEDALYGFLERFQSAQLHRQVTERSLRETHMTANQIQRTKQNLENDLRRIRDAVGKSRGDRRDVHDTVESHISEIDNRKALIASHRRSELEQELSVARSKTMQEYQVWYERSVRDIHSDIDQRLHEIRSAGEKKYVRAVDETKGRLEETLRNRVERKRQQSQAARARVAKLKYELEQSSRHVDLVKDLFRHASISHRGDSVVKESARMIESHCEYLHQRSYLESVMKLFNDYEKRFDASGPSSGQRRKQFLQEVFFHNVSYSPRLLQEMSQQLRGDRLTRTFRRHREGNQND